MGIRSFRETLVLVAVTTSAYAFCGQVAGTLPFDKNQNLVGEGSMQLQVRAVLDGYDR